MSPTVAVNWAIPDFLSSFAHPLNCPVWSQLEKCRWEVGKNPACLPRSGRATTFQFTHMTAKATPHNLRPSAVEMPRCCVSYTPWKVAAGEVLASSIIWEDSLDGSSSLCRCCGCIRSHRSPAVRAFIPEGLKCQTIASCELEEEVEAVKRPVKELQEGTSTRVR